MNELRKINELEGHEVECKNVADGNIVWKVVREVEDDQRKRKCIPLCQILSTS